MSLASQSSLNGGTETRAHAYFEFDYEGFSHDSDLIISHGFEAARHYFFPVSRESLFQKFHALTSTWRAETAHLSSVTQMAMHPTYQHIIGMGPAVVPLLLNELKHSPDHWYWALKAITGVDPVPPSDRGNIKKMAEAWVRWGKEQGYI